MPDDLRSYFYRIEEYDGEQVTFCYKYYDDSYDYGHKVKVTMDIVKFIGKITQHISLKGFKWVRRYGLYSGGWNIISQQVVHLYNFVDKEKY